MANNLITSKDIKNGTIKVADLSKKLRARIKNRRAAAAVPGERGSGGPNRPNGRNGPNGPNGRNGRKRGYRRSR